MLTAQILTGSDPDAPVAAREGEPDCARCGNKRFLIDEAGGLVPCPACGVAAAWKLRSLQAYGSQSGRTREQTFDNYQTALNGKPLPALVECLAAARTFAQSLSGWFIIHGKSGNGKTHLCSAVYNAICQTTPAIFITMPELLQSLKERMDSESGGESYSARLQKYQAVAVLILDDVGTERGSAWSDAVLFQIVDYRYRNRLPAMFATNLDPYDDDAFDGRVIDRWTDTEFSVVIDNPAPSFRQRKKR
jgi:DNA replication protein DnaC